ncbi:transposase [Chroococcidiopsis sp. FACHB-1243]|nr:transposase [Chroococcidiopsis sp. [FACHB-1243]]
MRIFINKLKLIKRSAYGFRNFENFRVRCLLNWHFNCWFSILSLFCHFPSRMNKGIKR